MIHPHHNILDMLKKTLNLGICGATMIVITNLKSSNNKGVPLSPSYIAVCYHSCNAASTIYGNTRLESIPMFCLE